MLVNAKKKNEIGFMVRLVVIQSPLFSVPLGCAPSVRVFSTLSYSGHN